MTSLYQILMLILNLAIFLVFAHVIMTWLVQFQILNLRQPLVAQLWYGIGRLLDPIYARVRRVLPDLNGLDLAPLVVLLGLYALRIILANNQGFFLY